MDPNLRISDAEREQAATALAEHYAEGRLTHDEHAERLDAIWTARTGADLAPIFDDLPGGSRGPVARREKEPRSGSSRRGFLAGLRALPLLPVIAVLVLLSVVTHLPFWILIFFVAFGRCGGRHHARGWGGPHHARGWH